MCPNTLTTHTPQPPRQGALFVSAPLWSATRGRHKGVRPMHMQKQKKMYMLARSLRTCERKSIDAALLRLDEPLPSFGPEVVTDAHAMLVKEKRMRIDWATLPSAVDPHSTTWRGSSIPGDGSVDTTSHATMRKTINPRSERKRAQVENFASMLSAAAPPAGSRVVDFGAGTGNLVLPLASLFPQATLGTELELVAQLYMCPHTATVYVVILPLLMCPHTALPAAQFRCRRRQGAVHRTPHPTLRCRGPQQRRAGCDVDRGVCCSFRHRALATCVRPRQRCGAAGLGFRA